jgi:mannose-6-phosphate isomerase-like protein (cupin superfamily)
MTAHNGKDQAIQAERKRRDGVAARAGGPRVATSSGPPGSLALPAAAASAFPGATGVTMLEVYDWAGPDGLRGGSAHVHFASTEGYVIAGGSGRLQTLGEHGYAEVPLRTGDCLWFTPGTIHRLINDGGLRILVVMQNAGLPEAGDCVLTFPPGVLADRTKYAAAATLPAASGPGRKGAAVPDEVMEAAARRRKDLAIKGFLALRDHVASDGPAALEGFFAAALRLVAARVPGWRDRWRADASAVAGLTGQYLDSIEAMRPAHLMTGSLWRITSPAEPPRYGMCGRLTVYDAGQASVVG